MASISHHKTAMSFPAVIESGGYNQEARQDPATAAGYIYSSTGDDVEAYMQDVVPFLPAFISFGPVASANDLSLGLPGQNAIPSTTTIYPYEGAADNTLPRTLIINAGATTLEFTLIAKIVSLTPVASATPDSSGDAGWSQGEIERHTVTTLHKDSVLQELVGEAGDRYALVSAFDDPNASVDYAPTELNGLAAMPLPKGYHYESSILSEELVLTSLDVATILIYSSFNFQRYVEAA